MAPNPIRSRWIDVGGMVLIPPAIMAAVILLVWDRNGQPGSSALAQLWPYVLGLGAGTPFLLRLAPRHPALKVLVVAVYGVCGYLALTYFTLVISCARGRCL
jgi:hypothetical protein